MTDKPVGAMIFAVSGDSSFNSAKPVSLHEVCGLTLMDWALRSVEGLITEKPILVCGAQTEAFRERFESRGSFAVENGRIETDFDAVRTLDRIADNGGSIFVLSADSPLLTAESMKALLQSVQGNSAAVLTYDSDSTKDEKVECRAAAFCFNAAELLKLLDAPEDEAINDMLECVDKMRRSGKSISALYVDKEQCLEVYDRITLAECERVMRRRINLRHLKNGVTMIDPDAAYIDEGVKIARDCVIHPGVTLSGETVIGENTVLHSGTRLDDTVIGRDCVLQAVVGNAGYVADGVTIGPFVNLRPGTRIADKCKIGDFVEIKNSSIDEGSKVPHLTYVGDADVGKRVNVGCGTVFVNYDGFIKHRTKVGDDVFLGCNSNLVAPVTVEDDAFIAAGSTITDNVPKAVMAIARARQVNKLGWVEKYRVAKKAEKAKLNEKKK